jgi:hypothetical protein
MSDSRLKRAAAGTAQSIVSIFAIFAFFAAKLKGL